MRIDWTAGITEEAVNLSLIYLVAQLGAHAGIPIAVDLFELGSSNDYNRKR